MATSTSTDSDLPRALVIVDSRNVVGQAARQLGEPAHPDVESVVRTFALYGFAVQAVHVALGLPRSADRAKLQGQLKVNEAFRDRVLEHPMGDVLLGELHAREKAGGRIEAAEKMVDTRCAVDVVRHARDIASGSSPFDAIIVVSEDIDLAPAYQYADDLGVPVFPAAAAVIDRRGDYHKNFLLLPPDAIAKLAPPASHGRSLRGHDLRARTADAFKTQARLSVRRVTSYEGPHHGAVLCTDDGLLAVAADHEAPNGVDQVEVYANGLDFGVRSDPLFPYLRCSVTRSQGDRHHRTAVAMKWQRPGVLDVTMGNGSERSLSQVPMGYVTPGTKLLVYVKDGSSKFVGVLGEPAPLSSSSGSPVDTRLPATAQVTQVRKGRVRGLLADGSEVMILSGRNVALAVGDRLAVMLVGNAGPGWLAAQAISTRLPPQR